MTFSVLNSFFGGAGGRHDKIRGVLRLHVELTNLISKEGQSMRKAIKLDELFIRVHHAFILPSFSVFLSIFVESETLFFRRLFFRKES